MFQFFPIELLQNFPDYFNNYYPLDFLWQFWWHGTNDQWDLEIKNVILGGLDAILKKKVKFD